MIDFFYTFGLVLELSFVIFLFTNKLPKKKTFWLGFSLDIIFIAMFCLYRKNVVFNNVYIKIISYLLLYIFIILIAFIKFKSSFKSTAFCMVGAIAAQHLSYLLGDFLRSIVFEVYLNPPLIIGFLYTIIVVVIDLLLYISFSMKADPKNLDKIQTGPIVGCSIVLFVVCVVSIQFYEFYKESFSMPAYIIFIVLDTSCCILTYLIQAVSYHATRSIMEAELAKLRLGQFDSLKNVMDIMNIRLHDLKHQIKQMEQDNTVDPSALKELRDTISSYRHFARVGNDSLDAILTEKSFVCEKENIRFTYNINGKLFNDFKVSEINSIFGNAFDNAIEYLVKLPIENRFFTIRSSEVGNLGKISFENYYVGKPTFNKDGLLNTTKTNTLYHGFGLRSIQNIIKKHQGNMTITIEDNTFKLQILFPCANKEN